MNFALLFASAGGAAGAVSRYVLGLYIMKKLVSQPFPLAMLIVNVLGSFGLGFFYGAYFQQIPQAYEEPLFLFLALGYFGAFTTFSTFSVEAVQLYQQRRWLHLFLYMGLSIFGSICLFMTGFMVMR
ncbi:fluoride efflux transporter CrcB [Halalkalibacter oceani]|uniref:Fluoride-specific ion channel FluC n=1 Tax=Halalkalibacter oceani TaxID=1653776 RepID=A0A9X2DRJ6_9BACI|nr:fluoride efflux transporter CrcB [Halalkalibacter oceani]MCM3715811.1 fluoride efflux transporter CrcB [Halalkalibacter oceani]